MGIYFKTVAIIVQALLRKIDENALYQIHEVNIEFMKYYHKVITYIFLNIGKFSINILIFLTARNENLFVMTRTFRIYEPESTWPLKSHIMAEN